MSTVDDQFRGLPRDELFRMLAVFQAGLPALMSHIDDDMRADVFAGEADAILDRCGPDHFDEFDTYLHDLAILHGIGVP